MRIVFLGFKKGLFDLQLLDLLVELNICLPPFCYFFECLAQQVTGLDLADRFQVPLALTEEHLVQCFVVQLKKVQVELFADLARLG